MEKRKPMKKIPTKWISMAGELFQFFKRKMADNGYVCREACHPIWVPEALHNMHRLGTYQEDVEEMLEFAIKNWKDLHQIEGLSGLTQEPGFNQLFGGFKYPILIHMAKGGFEDFKREKKKEDSKKKLDDKEKKTKFKNLEVITL